MTGTDGERAPWLFSRNLDVAAFGGSALLSLALVAVGVPLGIVDKDTPEWTWIATVLLVDVAHVWGSILLVYTDPQELQRRPLLYGLVPVLCYGLGVAVCTESSAWFWRALAYLAVLHFVRQQTGWVKLYRARARDDGGAFIDLGATYAATLGPLVWWHAHLPTSFQWFVDGDFVCGLPAVCGTVALVVEAAFLVAYGVRAARSWARGRGNPGKDLVVVTTALLWWLGIVALGSDYAFTVTNVLIHGIPYAFLIAWTARRRREQGLSVAFPLRHAVVVLVLALWTCAFFEEGLWDRLVWHERPWLFPGAAVDLEDLRAYVVPLLALPQLVHYVLDGFLWKRRDNKVLASAVSAP